MKKPTLRVTKWLADIPVEAHCTQCLTVSFKAQGAGHRPNREEYQKSLQAQFEVHCKGGAFRNVTDSAATLIRTVKPARGPVVFLAFSCPIRVSVQR
jgi:hypothetical protein